VPVAVLLAVLAACAPRAPAAEAERARATAERIEQELPLLATGPVPAFVRRLGEQLGRHAPSAPHRWSFVVIRDRSANAFAIGAGRIYVNDGAVRVCRTEGELAAILAHEMGHQLAGHLAAPSAPQRGTGGAALGTLAQRVDPAQEREADRLSLRILTDAGYDPRAALTLARRLGDERAEHFGDAGRIAELERLLRDAPAGGREDSEEFRALRAALAEGDAS
jgi:predicted Zn-dependent protease